MYCVGDLIKVVDDPYSFSVKEAHVGLLGLVINVDNEKNIYQVLISDESSNTIYLLDFMMEKVQKQSRKETKASRHVK